MPIDREGGATVVRFGRGDVLITALPDAAEPEVCFRARTATDVVANPPDTMIDRPNLTPEEGRLGADVRLIFKDADEIGEFIRILRRLQERAR